MAGVLVLAGVGVGIPFLMFSLPESFAFTPRSIRSAGFDDWSEWVKPWQVGLALILAVVLLMAMNAPPASRDDFAALALAVIVLPLFLRAWRREFLFLMALRDDDFPGRHDKVIWAVALLAFAPVALWVFRSYRLAHYPEPKPEHVWAAPEVS